MLPIDHRRKTQQGVTILGDAATSHVLLFAGEGVNLAILDATELALAITSSHNLTKVIHEYEQKICARAAKAAEESSSNLDLFMAPGNTAAKVAELFKIHMANGPPDDEKNSF